MDKEPKEEEEDGNVSDAPMPFTEQEITELSLLPPRLRAAIIQERERLIEEHAARVIAEEKALAFEEEKKLAVNNAARDQAKAAITAARLPPALKTELLAAYDDTIQFSEGCEQPTYTAVEVAELLAGAIPPNLRFEEEEAKEADAPQANSVIGKDMYGNPVFSDATTEQFFEAKSGMPSYSTLHVSAERAEELAKASPMLQTTVARGMPTIPPATPSRS